MKKFAEEGLEKIPMDRRDFASLFIHPALSCEVIHYCAVLKHKKLVEYLVPRGYYLGDFSDISNNDNLSDPSTIYFDLETDYVVCGKELVEETMETRNCPNCYGADYGRVNANFLSKKDLKFLMAEGILSKCKIGFVKRPRK